MTVDFNDYFWGEKNNGFDVLYHNMKFGVVASKELSEFFREKSSIEEQSSKMMSKLAHKAGTGTLNNTFAPIWTILRTSAERISSLHAQMVQKLTELVKDVAKYADELHKKHKTVKEEEAQTLECVQAMQTSTAAVQKSHDLYSSKVQELEKLRKENASHKDIEKVESKLKKLQDDYKALLDKHNPIKAEFERRMTQTCKRFQEIEEVHLRQMKEFLSTYLELLQNNHDMVGQVHSDFKRQFLDMSVDKLLEQFVLNKYTGLEKPIVPELDFVPLSTQQQSTSTTRLNQPSLASGTTTNSNSATSIQGAMSRITAGSVSLDQRGGSEGISLGGSNSGSASLLNADDSILGFTTTARPTSPELLHSIGSASSAAPAVPPSMTAASTTTAATTSTTSATSTFAKSNFRNWFLPSNPSNKQNANATNLNVNATSAPTSVSTSSGNFGMDCNGSPTAATGHIMINSPNQSELQSLQDNNNQVSGILRSRRDKAKTKKSKKKKDDDNAENIKEERLTSLDRTQDSHEHDEHGNKMKTQNSSGSSAGGLPISSASAPGSVDSSAGAFGLGSVLAGTNSGAAGGGGNTGSNLLVSGTTVNLGTSGNAASGATGYGGNEVDEDGYSIQPPKEIAWEENRDNAGSFYSDSDSDSDNDKPERRIHVKIKPLNNGQAPMSASVDELRATVENISLSPTGVFSHSQQLQQARLPSRQQSPEISNASTPTASVHPYAPLQSPTLSMSNNNSRYADLGDIFSELGDVSASAPASATLSKSNSRQIPTPTSVTSSIAIPRPPSRRSEMATAAAAAANVAGARSRNSPSPMNRADSIGSLEFRTAIGGIGSSRGPSPLTIGISDTIPLAVAFHEIIHAFFRGSDESRCQVKISGDMMISFPAGIAGLLANNPNPTKLFFRIKNIQNLENFLPNGKLVQIDKALSSPYSTMLEFNMPALTAVLRRQAEHNPTAAYFNVDILKYQVRNKPGASSCPFQLVSYWKCEPTFTALKIDYKYNNHAMASASPLLNVTLSVPVNGSVRNVQSKPHSAWLGESNRLVWNFTDISQNSPDGGVGTLRARLELNEGPSTPALLNTQFNCEGTTLSGIEFELHGSGYRLSLVKRRFVSGKYVCEGDGVRSCITPTPPNVSGSAGGSCSPYSAKSN